MAPEQFSEASKAGVRCDIYSLAATLYMALTGALPFVGRSLAAVLKKKMKNDLVLPRQLAPDVSERVERAIRRALQADPKRRYGSCPEFIQALTGGTPGADAKGPAPAQPRKPFTERRKRVRYPCIRAAVCDLNASIHDGDPEAKCQWEGTIHDLSESGIGLVVSRRFEARTRLRLTLESPDRAHKRNVELEVARVTRAGIRHWFVGGAFVKPLQKEELHKLL
jgi:serine/threonine protein kinase